MCPSVVPYLSEKCAGYGKVLLVCCQNVLTAEEEWETGSTSDASPRRNREEATGEKYNRGHCCRYCLHFWCTSWQYFLIKWGVVVHTVAPNKKNDKKTMHKPEMLSHGKHEVACFIGFKGSQVCSVFWKSICNLHWKSRRNNTPWYLQFFFFFF